MIDLAAYLRFMQFYAHICHNLTSGPTFYQDHAAFGGLYEDYETAYDGVVERCIGLGLTINLFVITEKAGKLLAKKSDGASDPKAMFKSLLECEQKLCSHIDTLLGSSTEGTRQFLGNLCDESEVRRYRIGQRLK